MSLADGYELKINNNKEAMSKVIRNYQIMNKNNMLVNLNMNSQEPDELKQIQIDEFLNMQEAMMSKNKEESKHAATSNDNVIRTDVKYQEVLIQNN